MAKVIIETKDRRVAYKDAQGMLVTPYNKGENGWALEDETYDIFAIVGDTLSITQDEESTDETPHEFSDENLEENTSLGNLNFTAECTDYQDSVLKKVYGFTERNGILLAPSEYKDRYVLIQILFDPELGQNNVVLPFVKLNGRPAFESMRSGTAKGNISGIAKTRDVLTVTDKSDMPTTYVKSDVDKCPMAFIPSGHALMVSSGGKMTYVDPEDGSQADATLSDSWIARPTISTDSLTFGSSADSTGQVVECSEAPESAIAYTSKTGPTYVSADWCTAAIGAGSNSDKITVTVNANNTGESRTAYIQVEFANNVKEWVTVTQAAGE